MLFLLSLSVNRAAPTTCRLASIRPWCLNKTCIAALVLSRLDYCNAVLAGLPASTLTPPQKVLPTSSSTYRVKPQTARPCNSSFAAVAMSTPYVWLVLGSRGGSKEWPGAHAPRESSPLWPPNEAGCTVAGS